MTQETCCFIEQACLCRMLSTTQTHIFFADFTEASNVWRELAHG